MEIDPMDLNNHSDTESETNECQLVYNESSTGFNSKIMIQQELLTKIKASKLELRTEKVFRIPRLPRLISNLLKRENKIYYFVSTQELHVDIKDVSGATYLPLITRKEINENLRRIPTNTRSKISMVHLGAIKILVKSEFQEGINSPIKLALIDNRINDRKDCVLGAAKGNLAYNKFMFEIYPKFGLSLDSKNLDQVLSLVHHFEREDLMNEGDKPFSVTYLISYALTNSHHSIDYKEKEYIRIDDIFSEIGSVQEREFSDIESNSSWAIDIAKGKRILGSKEESNKGRFSVEESSSKLRRSFSKPLNTSRDNFLNERSYSMRSDTELLMSISDRVDVATQTLKKLCG